MRFISIRELRAKAARAWQTMSKQDDVVITSNGKPIAVLLPVDEGTLEEQIALLRRTRAQSALGRIHEETVRQGIDRISDQEIEEEVTRVRKERRGR